MDGDRELLPCPFCGGKPEIVTRDVEPQGDPWYGGKEETFVLCDCGACLFDGSFHEGFYNAETRAVEAWNRRSPPSAPRAEAVEAKDAAPTRAELLTALSAFVNWEGSRNPNGDDTLLPPEKQTRPFLAAAMRLIALAEAEDQRERELFGEYA